MAPSQVTNYKCPNCSGPLVFSGSEQKTVCEYCGSSFDIAEIEFMYASDDTVEIDPQWDTNQTGRFSSQEASQMRSYTCPSCGAILICDGSTAATSCPYCGNPTIIGSQFSGGLKPDLVIPFKLGKAAAVSALKEYYKGKKFLPKSFVDSNHIDEIKGVYVPFWLFDGKANASMRFRGVKEQRRTSNNKETIHKDYYAIHREGSLAFEKVPVDGSSQMPDTHMDAIEPFDYNGLQPFSMAYMPGYLASKYDEDAEECSKRANARIQASVESVFAGTVRGYSAVTKEYSRIDLSQGNISYALMPVWMLSTKWNGQSFLFAMNGQTGKLIGDLPVDNSMYWSAFAKIALPLAGILALILL